MDFSFPPVNRLTVDLSRLEPPVRQTSVGNVTDLISFNVQHLLEVSVFPFYRGIPIEVEPILTNGNGAYVSGQLMGHSFHTLAFDNADEVGDPEIGCSYSCIGRTEQGEQVHTHWLYCTDKRPSLHFGVVRNWARQNTYAPLSPLLAAEENGVLVKLEELFDLVAILQIPGAVDGLTQVQIGHRGWLVMAKVTTPQSFGILVESPTLPPMFPEGAGAIAVSAKSKRTLQSVSLDGLTCVAARDPALLLKVD
ncbi:hypothetical protein OA90_26070 [Labrenzia sp. OB1]|nr:hypothetical protein OA90_26070 [Labrenzia sp. OB1]